MLAALAKTADEALEPSDYLPPVLGSFSDSPTTFKGDAVDVAIPLSVLGGITGASFDGVTAGRTRAATIVP